MKSPFEEGGKILERAKVESSSLEEWTKSQKSSLEPPKLWDILPPVELAIEVYKWDLSRPHCVQEEPQFFPREYLQHEFERVELSDVCDRLSDEIRESSIQARYDSNPLSAKLETLEGVELYVVFFQERRKRRSSNTDAPVESGRVYLSLQRHKGDGALAAQYIRRLLDAAKGVSASKGAMSENRNERDVPMDPESLREIENLVDRLVSGAKAHGVGSPFESMTQEQVAEASVKDICAWLTSKTFNLRTHALECLLHMTDMKRTVSASAVAGALVVLTGKGPTPAVDEAAEQIQEYLLRILMNREILDDRDLINDVEVSWDRDGDDEFGPYFPDRADNDPNLPTYYCDYMNDLFHMALQIVVQSLEVVSTFDETLERKHNVIGQVKADDFLMTCSFVGGGKDLYKTLLGCIDRAESKQANGYLACKALRLLAAAFPTLRYRLQKDETARRIVGDAFIVGKKCYPRLKLESEQLWRTVRGQ